MRLSAEAPDAAVSLVHPADGGNVWATRGRSVFRAPQAAAEWTQIARFPAASRIDRLVFGRLAKRLLRSERCNVRPTRTGKLLGIRGGTVYSLGAHETRPLFEIQGHSVMNRAIAEDSAGNLYFGEYLLNPERGAVRIWRVTPDLDSFRVAYTFKAGKIRHIHAIHSDPYEPGRMWATMGDFQGECFVAYTDDEFGHMHFLGDGSQLWRAVGVIFQESRLCWLTDSHIEQNHVVAMDRSTQRVTVHGERDSSSWYAATTTDGLYLATTTVEIGPGIKTDRVRLLASEDALDWQPVAVYGKDRFPMRGFGFGSLSLPSGSFSADCFWISGEGIEELDGRSRRCRLAR